jgi:hypothetical protein
MVNGAFGLKIFTINSKVDLFVLNSIWDNIVEIRGKNDNKLNKDGSLWH